MSSSPVTDAFLKEQLRLYAFTDTLPPEPRIILRIQQGLTKREKLIALPEGELNFHGENSRYASHDLHAFQVPASVAACRLPRAYTLALELCRVKTTLLTKGE